MTQATSVTRTIPPTPQSPHPVEDLGKPGRKSSIFGSLPDLFRRTNSAPNVSRKAVESTLPSKLNGTSSSTQVICRTRSHILPPKPSDEDQRHLREHVKMMRVAKALEEKQEKAREKARARREKAAENAVRQWTVDILPRWRSMRFDDRTHSLWFEGLPPRLRSTIWMKSITDILQGKQEIYHECLEKARDCLTSLRVEKKSMSLISQNQRGVEIINSSEFESIPEPQVDPIAPSQSPDFETGIPGALASLKSKNLRNIIVAVQSRHETMQILEKDIQQTFPNLNLFQPPKGPLYEPLRNVLQAFSVHMPRIGYAHGMNYLVGLLLIYLDEFAAFTTLCVLFRHSTNILPVFYAMDLPEPGVPHSLSSGLLESYFEVWQDIVVAKIPDLAVHFNNIRLGPEHYLCDWIIPGFAKTLQFDTMIRVWDLWFRDGDSTFYVTACAILKVMESRLLGLGFEDCLYDLHRLPGRILSYDGDHEFGSFWKLFEGLKVDREVWRAGCRYRGIVSLD
jgi:hypothetical protein